MASIRKIASGRYWVIRRFILNKPSFWLRMSDLL
jgi:hypothetical protein